MRILTLEIEIAEVTLDKHPRSKQKNNQYIFHFLSSSFAKLENIGFEDLRCRHWFHSTPET